MIILDALFKANVFIMIQVQPVQQYALLIVVKVKYIVLMVPMKMVVPWEIIAFPIWVMMDVLLLVQIRKNVQVIGLNALMKQITMAA